MRKCTLWVMAIGVSVMPSPPPIAELVTQKHSVKIRKEGSRAWPAWEDIHSGQMLHRGQSLLTSVDSQAEISLLDGTKLIVEEKSEIVLEKTPSDDSMRYQSMIVKLKRGILQKVSPRSRSNLLKRVAEKTPGMEIIAGDTRIELSPASELKILTPSDDPKGAHIQVRSGEVRIQSPQGSFTLNSGEEVTLPQARQITPIVLLSPKPGETLEAKTATQSVHFRWKTSQSALKGARQEIEISRDRTFKTGVIRNLDATVNLPVTEEETHWYWRVRAHSSPLGSVVSDAESFWINSKPLPHLKYPPPSARITAEKGIEFSWAPVKSANGYELEVQGVSKTTTTQPFVRIDHLSVGKHRWRVRALLKNGESSDWTAFREISVTE